MKKNIYPKKTPAYELPCKSFNQPFKMKYVMPGPGIEMKEDQNGMLYISAKGGESVSDILPGDNINIERTEDGKIVISAIDTAAEIAAGDNISITIDPETGAAVINSVTGDVTDEHYQGVFDTADDLIAYDTEPRQGDYGMIKNIVFSDGGETSWNGQYKYCFYINGAWTVVDQMLTFTEDTELIKTYYSVGGSSPVIYLHEVARTGDFWSLNNIPIVATPEVTLDGTDIVATCATEGAEIWYTLDGSMPHVNGIKYEDPFPLTRNRTYRFVGIKNGMINSLEAVFAPDYAVQAPEIELDWHDGTITMTDPNVYGDGEQRGVIHYKLGDFGNWSIYGGPFSVADYASVYVYAKVVNVNMDMESETVVREFHRVKLSSTHFGNGASGLFGQFFYTFTPSEGEVHYTDDGSDPAFDSPDMSEMVYFPFYGGVKTLKARGFAEGYIPSPVSSYQFGQQKPVSPPVTFDPETNTVTLVDSIVQNPGRKVGKISGLYSEVWFAVSDLSYHSRIYYTLDGSTPTDQSTLFTGPFQISGNVTVKAVLVAYGQYYSDVVAENIVLIDAPAISLNSNTGEVSISGPSGSTLHYTTDGSTPTAESPEYSSPIVVSELLSSITVKAVAIDGEGESAVAEATYTRPATSAYLGFSTNYNTGAVYAAITRPSGTGTIRYTDNEDMPVYTDREYPAQYLLLQLFMANPPVIKLREFKEGYLPAFVRGYDTSLYGVYFAPDAPSIDVDESTGHVTLALSGNTADIPLQTNNNVPTMGARIWYTLDGSTPTAQNGTLYQGSAFNVPSGTTTIKAVTVCYGEFSSDVTTQEITPEPSGDGYLYFEAVEPNSTVSMMSTQGTAPDLEYSTDGETWQEWQHTTADNVHTFDTLTLTAVGDRVYLRGDNPDGLGRFEDAWLYSHFEMTGKIAVGGNIMSLLDKDAEMTEIPAFGFPFLFGDITEGNPNTSLTAAAAMAAVTTIGTAGCYNMYSGCTSLTAAADMPSLTTIGLAGCDGMYIRCTALTAAAAMPALTSIGEHGCDVMYGECTSLTAAAAMPALTSIGERGCADMYVGCTSLTEAADMPSLTTIGLGGCSYMYEECTSLTAAADMPSLTTIGLAGCDGMYLNCTFDMSSDGTTLNFDFPTPPVTAGEETYSTAYDVAEWMANTNGLNNTK